MTNAEIVAFYRPKVAGTALKQYICNVSATVGGTHGAGTLMIKLTVVMKRFCFFRGILLPLLVMAGLLSACTFGGDDDPNYNERLLQSGEVAPDFTAYTDEYPDGIALADLRGSYVLIEFWRSTCGDCHDVMPDMKRIYDTYAPRGLVVLGVSFDQNEDEWRTYIEDNGLEWMQHREQATASESPVGTAYHISWTPTFYLVNPQGRIDLATIYVDDVEKRLEETNF